MLPATSIMQFYQEHEAQPATGVWGCAQRRKVRQRRTRRRAASSRPAERPASGACRAWGPTPCRPTLSACPRAQPRASPALIQPPSASSRFSQLFRFSVKTALCFVPCAVAVLQLDLAVSPSLLQCTAVLSAWMNCLQLELPRCCMQRCCCCYSSSSMLRACAPSPLQCTEECFYRCMATRWRSPAIRRGATSLSRSMTMRRRP